MSNYIYQHLHSGPFLDTPLEKHPFHVWSVCWSDDQVPDKNDDTEIHHTQNTTQPKPPKWMKQKQAKERWDNINESKKKKALNIPNSSKTPIFVAQMKRRSTTRYFRLQQKLGFR